MNVSDFFEGLTKGISDQELMTANICSSVAAEIMKKRLAMNMNQHDFASFLGVRQSTISKWESGQLNFTLEKLSEIACKLGIKVSLSFCDPSVEMKSEPVKENKYYSEVSSTPVYTTPPNVVNFLEYCNHYNESKEM